jgi:Asp-tRNA(Asn)/Glu-tRNA(Gln) amidotransferase A subunit family amidase
MPDLSAEIKRQEILAYFSNLSETGPVTLTVKEIKLLVKNLIGTEPAVEAKYNREQLLTEMGNTDNTVKPALEQLNITFFDGLEIQKISIML